MTQNRVTLWKDRAGADAACSDQQRRLERPPLPAAPVAASLLQTAGPFCLAVAHGGLVWRFGELGHVGWQGTSPWVPGTDLLKLLEFPG